MKHVTVKLLGCQKSQAASMPLSKDQREWCSLQNLLPFLGCFPKDVLVIKSPDGKHPATIGFRENYTPRHEDFRRCEEVAKHIQRLGHGTSNGHSGSLDYMQEWELEQEVYDVLVFRRILPLQHLESYHVRTKADLLNLHRVAGPKTTSVTLQFSSTSHEPHDESIQLGPLPPNLRKFCVRAVDDCLWDNISTSLSRFFKEKPHHHLNVLQLLSCKLLDTETFRTVLSLPSLRELHLGEMATQYFEHVPTKSAQRLSHLQMTVHDIPHISEFLSRIGHDGLSKLELLSVNCHVPRGSYLLEPPLAESIEGLFRNIRTKALGKSKSLVVAELTFVIDDRDASGRLQKNLEYAVREDTVRELYEFPNLSRATLCFEVVEDGGEGTVRFEHSSRVQETSGSRWFQSKGRTVRFHVDKKSVMGDSFEIMDEGTIELNVEYSRIANNA